MERANIEQIIREQSEEQRERQMPKEEAKNSNFLYATEFDPQKHNYCLVTEGSVRGC